MEALTGDETGLIKVLEVSKREFFTYGTQVRTAGIEGLSWLKCGYNHSHFAALRANSQLEVWSYAQGSISMKSSIHLPAIENPLTVSHIETNRVICVDKSGQTSIVKFRGGNDASTSSNGKKLKSVSDWEILKTFQVKGPVGACATCNGGAAFGGAENDVVVYDLSTQQAIWNAKNVPYDTLGLRVPIWVAAISFLNAETASPSTAQFVSGTGHKHVRLYDIKASQQPSYSIDIGGDYRVTSIQPTGDGNALFVADCSGGLAMWDLRMSRRKISVLKGSSGSIRSLHLTPSGNHLASVGLDRFLRVYDTSKTHTGEKDSTSGFNKINCSSKMVCAAYLKNRLNCCLLADIEVKKSKVKAVKNRGVVGDDDTLRSNPNFDSDAEDDEDDVKSDDNENDDDEEMNVDEDEDDGEEESDDEDDNEEDEEGSDGDEEGADDEDADDQDDSDGVDDSGDDSDVDRKGVGKGQYSSRRERVAAVTKVTNSKAKAKANTSSSKTGNQNQSKKRRL